MDKKESHLTENKQDSPSEDKDTPPATVDTKDKVSDDVSKSADNFFSENNDIEVVPQIDSKNVELATRNDDVSASQNELCDAKNDKSVSHSDEKLISSVQNDDTETSVEQNYVGLNVDGDKNCETSTEVKEPTLSAKSTPTKKVENASKRPDRKCKTTTKALMLSCSFADDDDESETESSEEESDQNSVVDANNIDVNIIDKNNTDKNTDKGFAAKNVKSKKVSIKNELDKNFVEASAVDVNDVDQNSRNVFPFEFKPEPEIIDGESNSIR